MSSLRARKKADKERRILEAATQLFREQGYDQARMDEIAVLADVSVGTLYNYYENKSDILVATVNMEVCEVLEAGEAIVANPPDDTHRALTALIDQYYDHSLVYLSKEMWRIAMAAAIQQPETPFSRRYTELDQRLCKQVVQLMQTLQARGAIIAELDTDALGQVVFNNLNAMFGEFCRQEAMSLEDLKDRVARQHKPIADLIASPVRPRPVLQSL